MTTGKKVAIAIHCAGVTLAAFLVLGAAKLLMGTVSTSVILASAVFYFGTVAFATARVLSGTDEKAERLANFIDGK
ncbi:hypothetical protein [Cellvibrio sp. pealriver]|uniref:hypothetical protein n=1 Tax=Cellvibrio sp. pealriver TaxID=1622269 RepID=UPI00066FFC7F|nr:hypothetical protein [Cellvibrio sp. pealriver]